MINTLINFLGVTNNTFTQVVCIGLFGGTFTSLVLISFDFVLVTISNIFKKS